MSNNPKDPMSRFFEMDIVKGKRSLFNWSYKNRISADYGYLYPVGLWDVLPDTHFELDVFASLSSNPTIAPLLGKVKFRLEAYFVEKASYSTVLRNNDRLPLDRSIPWPVVDNPVGGIFSPRTSLTEMLQMFPAGYDGVMFRDYAENPFPALNAIPFLMYYDIYRNYYVNPQDDKIPLRSRSYVPGELNPDYTPDGDEPRYLREPIQISDVYISRSDLDKFITNSRSSQFVDVNYFDQFGIPMLPEFRVNSFRGAPTDLDHQSYQHYGLLRRTYNNDFFTSFISNSNVDLMKSHANVSVIRNGEQSYVNVEQISLANRNWRISTRSILWGTDWKDYNKVHYGVNLLIPYGKPQFLGSLSVDVTFNDVISQAQTGSQDSAVNSNVNLGSRAGLAYGVLRNGDRKFVEFNTKDEGYVMVLASLVPEVDYYQGIDPMYFKTSLRHSWMQELNSVGMQDFHRSWASCSRSQGQPQYPAFDVYNDAIHQVPIWFEYMAKYNQLHGEFTGENQLRYWTFARPFDSLNRLFPNVFHDETVPVEDQSNFSTYVLPELFNYVFANNIGKDNYQLQFYWDCKVSNMLDKQVIAYL